MSTSHLNSVNHLNQYSQQQQAYSFGRSKSPQIVGGQGLGYTLGPNVEISNQAANPGYLSYLNSQSNSRLVQHPISGNQSYNAPINSAYLSHSNLAATPIIPINSQSRLVGQATLGNKQIYSPNLYSNIQGFKQKKQTERRVTYHPYTRTYIDYEQQVILVPVERIKVKYYEKITQTNYVPTAIEEVITETVAVEKQTMRVRYIPVEQQIIHYPKQVKKYVRNQEQNVQTSIHGGSGRREASNIVQNSVQSGYQVHNVVHLDSKQSNGNNGHVVAQSVRVQSTESRVDQNRPVSGIQNLKDQIYDVKNDIHLDESQINEKYQHWQQN